MQIKIGFTHSARGVVVQLPEDSDKSQADYVAELEAFLASDNAESTFVLEGARGTKTILRKDQIAFIEVGPKAAGSVGFSHEIS